SWRMAQRPATRSGTRRANTTTTGTKRARTLVGEESGREVGMARNLSSKKDTRTKGRKVGIPGETYRVELKGNAYYVANAATRVSVAGPYKTREAAQRRSDELERTVR